MDYFSSDKINKIQRLIKNYLTNITLIKSNSSIIKRTLFDAFESDAFLSIYKSFAIEVATYFYGTPSNTCLQTSPTPRIFFPNSHGTSIHSDYWYGHGLSAITTWIPILNSISGATFYADHRKNLNNFIDSPNFDLNNLVRISKEIAIKDNEVLPPDNSAFLFDSKMLHGSTFNATNKTRISFDFRISKIEDPTSTKDLENYLIYDDKINEYKLPYHKLHGKRILKYICGGHNKNTFAQQILIDSFSKRYNLQITDQEAEIERYKYPILDGLSKGYKLKNEYDAIVLASEYIAHDFFSKKKNISSKIPIWSALENKQIL